MNVVNNTVTLADVRAEIANRSAWVKKDLPTLEQAIVNAIIGVRDVNDAIVPIGAKVGVKIYRFAQLPENWTASVEPLPLEVKNYAARKS